MENNTQIEKQDNNPIRAFFASEAVVQKFKDLLGQARAQSFVTSVLQIAQGNDKLKTCNPVSLFNAAATAATLDLPINQSLGFAWIVPYGGQAQFQMGYKGFIQLAQRSGQYLRLNVIEVHQNQFKKWNALTEELEAAFEQPGDNTIVGYCAYFELLNGYKKTVYWSKEMVITHAKKYSKNYDGLWKTDFDKMAKKTVLKAMLSTWGILSVQMQKAIVVDQAVIEDLDNDQVSYPDNEETLSDKASKANKATENGMKDLLNTTPKNK